MMVLSAQTEYACQRADTLQTESGKTYGTGGPETLQCQLVDWTPGSGLVVACMIRNILVGLGDTHFDCEGFKSF